MLDQGYDTYLSFNKPPADLAMAPSMTSAEQPDVAPFVCLPGGLLRYDETLYAGAARLITADLCPDDSGAIRRLLRDTLDVYHSGHGLSEPDVTPAVMDLDGCLQVLPWFRRAPTSADQCTTTEIPCHFKTHLIYLNRQELMAEGVHLLDELNEDNHSPATAYSELRYRTVAEITASIRDDQGMPHHLEAIESLSLAHSRDDDTTGFFHHSFTDLWPVVNRIALAVHRGLNNCSVRHPIERCCRCCGERLTVLSSCDTSRPVIQGQAHIDAAGERFDTTAIRPDNAKVGPEYDTPEVRGDAVTPLPQLILFRGPGGENGWASNWYKKDFNWAGRWFHSGQQAIAYAKARIFGDTLAASQILQVATPSEARALGLKICGFDLETWDKNKYKIITSITYARRRQYSYETRKILETARLAGRTIGRNRHRIVGRGRSQLRPKPISSLYKHK